MKILQKKYNKPNLKTLVLLLLSLILINYIYINGASFIIHAQSAIGCWVTTVGTPNESIPKPECPKQGGGLPGQPLPSDDPLVIKQVLCDEYKVCPTESTSHPPSNAWTLDQLTALWNTVQRIYESETYKTYAIGNYTMEITRAHCYPRDCNDGTWGYYAGQSFPEWGTIPNSRLIVITNDINTSASQTSTEWLFSHEIGHSASGGLPDGSLALNLGVSEVYKNITNCGDIVSNYGAGDTNENHSDIVAFYMTSAEDVIGGYRGPSKNMLIDFPCSYEAVKLLYFDGREF